MGCDIICNVVKTEFIFESRLGPLRAMPLGEVAEVFTGYPYRVRGGLEKSPGGAFRILQMRDLTDEHFLNLDSADYIPKAKIHAKYFLKQNDILLVKRGWKSFPVALVEMDLEETVASDHFFVVRPNTTKVLSRFLHWYLNQERTQSSLRAISEGSSVASLSVKNVQQWPIETPEPQIQEKMATLADLKRRHSRLSKELDQKYKKLLEGIAKPTQSTPRKDARA